MTSAKERRLPRVEIDPGASINVMPLRALADLGMNSYEPAKSDQGYYSGVQCRLAAIGKIRLLCVPNMGSED